LVLVDQLNLLVFNKVLDVLLDLWVVESLLNISLEMLAHFLGQSSHKFVFDACQDSEQWSLRPDEEQSASVLDFASFDVLVQYR
jgi:hypothetical protein